MANLGAGTFTEQKNERQIKTVLLGGGITGNTTEWSTFSFTVPNYILSGILRFLAVRTLGAATPHQPDYGTTSGLGQEVCQLNVRSGSSTPLAQHFLPSNSIQGYSDAAANTVADGWIAKWEFQHPVHIRGGDQLVFFCPPPDDNAVPTGDYNINITIDVQRYGKT